MVDNQQLLGILKFIVLTDPRVRIFAVLHMAHYSSSPLVCLGNGGLCTGISAAECSYY
jgi:hypothetical protein